MARLNTQQMPKAELLAELGKARVDDNTIAEIEAMQARAGEPDDNRTLDEILASPAADDEAFKFGSEDETPEPQAQVPEPETQEPAKELSIDDRLRIQEEQIRAQMEVYQKAVERQFANLRPDPQPAPQAQEPDYMQYTQAQIDAWREQDPYGAALLELRQADYRKTKELEQLRQHQVERDQDLVRARFSEALNAVKEKYSDAESFLPKELMTQALDMAVKSRNHSADFKGWMETTYRNAAFDAKVAQAQAKADELSQKRDEKRQASIKATQAAGGGGGVYQAPAFKTNDRSMRAGRADMLAELKALGG